MIAVAVCSLFSTSAEAQSRDAQIAAAAYQGQGQCATSKGVVWYTLATFETEEEAEEYEAFLWFVSFRDDEKLLKEMNLPVGYFFLGFFRTTVVYTPDQLMATYYDFYWWY